MDGWKLPYWSRALLGLVGAVVSMIAAAAPAEESLARATFAGGCFWCMEGPFDRLDGVVDTTVGYTGGDTVDPTYEAVSAGGTGHAEAVRIRFDPERISFSELLEVYWRNVDPLTENAQFCDEGAQYRSAIFTHDDQQLRIARASKRALEASGRFDRPIVTEIVPAGPFYEAEARHQDYAQKNPIRYRIYRFSCGRDDRLEALWGDEAGGHGRVSQRGPREDRRTPPALALRAEPARSLLPAASGTRGARGMPTP